MWNELFDLWFNFVQVGMFSIGGGYAMVPLIQEQIVNQNHWLSPKEFTDILTISQMTPGPLAVNASSFTGHKVAGILGAIVATLGCVISGFIISLSCYSFFCRYRDCGSIMTILRGLQAIATGLIGAAGAGILLLALTGESELHFSNVHFDYIAVTIAAVSMVLLQKFKFNTIGVMLVTAIAGIIVY